MSVYSVMGENVYSFRGESVYSGVFAEKKTQYDVYLE